MRGEGRAVPWIFAALGALCLGWNAIPPSDPPGEARIHEFGGLPIVYEGRTMPYDTLARNSLRFISGRETFVEETVVGASAKLDRRKRPAIKWLLDVISEREEAQTHKVFRIDNRELLDTLGLEAREGYRYSPAEFKARFPEAIRQAQEAKRRSSQGKRVDAYERKLLEFERKAMLFHLLSASHSMVPFSSVEEFRDLASRIKQLESFSLVHAVPPRDSRETWLPLVRAWVEDWKNSLLGKAEGRNPATDRLAAILQAYSQGDGERFNDELRRYREYLAEQRPGGMAPAKLKLEQLFMNMAPFFTCAFLYLAAFLLGFVSWVRWAGPLRRSATVLIVLTLAVHSVALAARIYISGRPPVTNLYSSAVFIGWACVLFGLLLERVSRMGIGNAIGSAAGFVTLLIAYYLSLEGDTFQVLQAVLDTNFWLATHVVCITLGYATTYLAGLLGILYILGAQLSGRMTEEVRKEISRLTYGTVCFALFFSFVGTVLGGLWADDSWGRFWGWDPKENGALLIVLWNALILHARWGGLVKLRGLAVLAVFGSIVTSWSWFGTNLLGVGLHAYGQQEATQRWLVVFVVSQFLLIAVGLLPTRYWRSYRSHPPSR